MSICLRLRKEVARDGKAPRGWQLAWFDQCRAVRVYYPVPLHYFLRALREISYRVRLALGAPGVETAQILHRERIHAERQRFADEYARGYLAGWHECFDTCMQAVEEEGSNTGELWNIGDTVLKATKPSREN